MSLMDVLENLIDPPVQFLPYMLSTISRFICIESLLCVSFSKSSKIAPAWVVCVSSCFPFTSIPWSYIFACTCLFCGCRVIYRWLAARLLCFVRATDATLMAADVACNIDGVSDVVHMQTLMRVPPYPEPVEPCRRAQQAYTCL